MITRILKWRPALPLAFRRKDRLELFFERRGHGQAFDDHVVQNGWIEFRAMRVFFGFGDEFRILQRFILLLGCLSPTYASFHHFLLSPAYGVF
jgi:hypothetical protein